MPLWALALVFLLVPVAELYVIYKVGDAIGVLPTFLLTPGFLTDVAGLLLLLPPTRSFVRRIAVRRLGRRVAAGVADRPGRQSWDVDGTATEHDAASGRLER